MPSLLAQLPLLVLVTLIIGVAVNLIEYGQLRLIKHAKSIAFSRHWTYAAIYLGTFAITAAAIAAGVFSESLIVRVIALAAIFIALLLDLCCRFVQGGNVGYNEVQTTLSESTFAGQFLSAHSGSVAKGATYAAVATAALLAASHWSPIRFDLWWLLLAPLAGVLAYAVVWKTVAATDVYPSLFRLPVLLAYVYFNPIKVGAREPSSMNVTDAPRPRVIILIMDESVTGEHLSINGCAKQNTPYLQSIADRYLNFGIACSASNISAATNVVVRSGLRSDQLPDRQQRGLSQTSIFQYAKAAGYRTVYCDGQYAPGVRGNFLTVYDLEAIDEMYWVIGDEPDTNKRYRRDRLIAQRILDRMTDGEPTFIWVNKYGAHFHFENTYPAEARCFEPTMPLKKSIGACTLEEIENSYANSLRWAVDGFFEVLAPALNLSDTVVLYTSDHGQSLEGTHGSSTHADTVDPPPIQANVPMLGWGKLLEQRFPDGIEAIRDRTSHFQLFSTALTLMGYEESEVTSRYGQPLWGSPPESRVFLSGDIFGRGIVHLNDFDTDRASQPSGSAASIASAVN